MEPQHDTILDSLSRIERTVSAIRRNTQTTWYRTIIFGMLNGAGFVLGTVLAITIAGWILSYLGVLPGLGDIAQQLKSALHRQ